MGKVVGWLDAVFGTIADLTIQDQEKNEQLNATWLWALVGIVACLYVKSWELTYTIRPRKKESRTQGKIINPGLHFDQIVDHLGRGGCGAYCYISKLTKR